MRTPVLTYLQRPGLLGSIGLLLLRLSIGVMMIHHGHEKLADPQQFANTYVASLHLPFPLFFAYAAGFSELIGSWMVILGLFTPLGALALTATMATAAYQHILTAGLNIYVLELVVLYLGGSLAVLFNGPGRFSFDAGLACELFADLDNTTPVSTADQPSLSGNLTPVAIRVGASARLRNLDGTLMNSFLQGSMAGPKWTSRPSQGQVPGAVLIDSLQIGTWAEQDRSALRVLADARAQKSLAAGESVCL